MSIPTKVRKHLDKRKVKYAVLEHRPVYTAFDLATTLGRPLGEVTKTVIVRAGRDLAFVSVPANRRLDFVKVAKALGVKSVSMASEGTAEKLGIAEGTTPPFASLYGVRCVMDRGLTKCREIVCRSGSRTESLECRAKDVVGMEEPIIADVTEKWKKGVAPKPKAKKRARQTRKQAPRRRR